MFIIKDDSNVKFNVWNYGIMSKKMKTLWLFVSVYLEEFPPRLAIE